MDCATRWPGLHVAAHYPPASWVWSALRNLGQDDPAAWLLIPVLGLMLSAAMLTAIVYALTPDVKWDARHNPGQPGASTGLGAGAGSDRRAAGGRCPP
jgi:hypothetical protein